MKRHVACSVVAALAGTSLLASVSLKEGSVSLDVGYAARMVKVSYEIEGEDDAVVTFDVLTNGVSIGGSQLKGAIGDVCKIVSPGARSFVWYPESVTASSIDLGAAEVKVNVWALDNPPAYMVCDLETGTRRYYDCPDALPGEHGVTNDIYKSSCLVMRKIPAKGVVWRMGKLGSESSAISAAAEAQHYVKFESDYYIGVYEFTCGQYRRARGYDMTAENQAGETYPVTNMSWSAIRGTNWNTKDPTSGATIGQLRTLMDGIEFELTTDEQWEYACRACTATPFANGTALDPDEEMGWYSSNSGGHSHPVGLKKPNAWGLYDMHGNVWEHCLDAWYEPTAGATAVATLHSDGGSNNQKVARGGCFRHNTANYARSAAKISRNYNGSFDQGFRLACPAVAK